MPRIPGYKQTNKAGRVEKEHKKEEVKEGAERDVGWRDIVNTFYCRIS